MTLLPFYFCALNILKIKGIDETRYIKLISIINNHLIYLKLLFKQILKCKNLLKVAL